jgi:hypothetical protein
MFQAGVEKAEWIRPLSIFRYVLAIALTSPIALLFDIFIRIFAHFGVSQYATVFATILSIFFLPELLFPHSLPTLAPSDRLLLLVVLLWQSYMVIVPSIDLRGTNVPLDCYALAIVGALWSLALYGRAFAAPSSDKKKK